MEQTTFLGDRTGGETPRQCRPDSAAESLSISRRQNVARASRPRSLFVFQNIKVLLFVDF